MPNCPNMIFLFVFSMILSKYWIIINDSIKVFHTLFSCWFCEFFFHLTVNGYEDFNLIIQPFNRNSLFTFWSSLLYFINFCFFPWYSFRFRNCCPISLLLVKIGLFPSSNFYHSSHVHISTTFYSLRHLWFNHFYIHIIKQLKFVEIPTS